MKKRLLCAGICALSLIISAVSASACTLSYWAPEKQHALTGRNMDWFSEMGTRLWIFPRGLERNGQTAENPMHWTSKYGSLSISIWDCLITEGVNEKGLVANNLYLPETSFEKRNSSQPGMGMSIWLQYYLDNFATVDEAVAATTGKDFQVQSSKLTLFGKTAAIPLHIALTDAHGDCAIIELLDGKTIIHREAKQAALTNTVYATQKILARQYQGLGGKHMLPGSSESEDRYARTAFYLTKLPQDASSKHAVAGLMSIMRNAATPIGANDPKRPNIAMTLWSTVTDSTTQTMYFSSSLSPNTLRIDLNACALDKGASILSLDPMHTADTLAGDVQNAFAPHKDIHFVQAGQQITWAAPQTK